MHPLSSISEAILNSYSPKQFVGNFWTLKNQFNKAGETQTPKMGMKVYLSTNEQFTADFIIDEYSKKLKQKQLNNEKQDQDENAQQAQDTIPRKKNYRHDNILLWEEPFISSSSLSKSFILAKQDIQHDTSASNSFQMAQEWLDAADQKEIAQRGGGSISAVMSSAGDGIESTSVILTLYKSIEGALSNLLWKDGVEDGATSGSAGSKDLESEFNREVVYVPQSSSIWKNLMNNATVNVRVVITREGRTDETFQTAMNQLIKDEKAHDLLVDGVDLVKYEIPYHISKAKRYLYKDVLYMIQKYILSSVGEDTVAPWDMSVTKPKEYQLHEQAMDMKERGAGYPYWKPEVAVKLVSETSLYPLDYVGSSHMDVIQVSPQLAGRKPFESGYAYLPGLYVDEMGLTSEMYIPVNNTVDALPLRISFDSGDVLGNEDDEASGNGLSPGRWRLLRHLANNLESQKDFGFEESDIDDVKRLIADTNVTLLGITVVASVLHLLFEFLTFKNDVEFWRGNKDLTGLSVRALFMDFFSQAIILLYLIEMESSLLMTIPAACGCLIALWKAQRGSGLKFVKAKPTDEKVIFYNRVLRIVGIELQATRLRAAASKGNDKKTDDDAPKDLAALSEETDQLATRLLGKYLMFPLILAYTGHTLINEEHSGWYSWFITSASSAMYGLGFVFMTPQLFMNYKLKSVAHLPWKVLGYRFVNTFIDDLFAFIIRMPTMARISCFRDDIVFIIYLWQRYLYPVDTSRPVEGGGMDAISAAAQAAIVEDEDESKKNQ